MTLTPAANVIRSPRRCSLELESRKALSGKEAELSRNPAYWLLGLAPLILSSGATCDRYGRQVYPAAPPAFVRPPTIDEVIYAVNTNTSRVHSLQTDSASLSSQGYPSLRASIALECPRRLRLRGTSFIGPELDVGSNDEVFWLWAKSNPEPVIYYARHDQFGGTAAQHILPVQPEWLIEAFGLVSIEPTSVIQGPATRPDGHMEIRSRAGSAGQYVRTAVVHETYGWVVEQTIMNSAGQLLASARISEHRFYPNIGASLPHHIQIEFPPAQMSFAIDVRQFAVNQLSGDPTQLWSLPEIEGYRLMNLAQMPPTSAQSPWFGASKPVLPHAHDGPLTTSYRPRYRGYSATRY